MIDWGLGKAITRDLPVGAAHEVGHAAIADDDVETTEVLIGPIDEAESGLGLAQIGTQAQRLNPAFGLQFLGYGCRALRARLFVAARIGRVAARVVVDDYVVAPGGKRPHDGRADAAAGTADQTDWIVHNAILVIASRL